MDNKNLRNIWPAMIETAHALGAHYRPAMERTAQQHGLAPAEYGVLLVALMFAPHPVAVWNLRLRGPYTSAGRYDERLRQAARLGYFKVPHEGEYRLTDLGQRTAQRLLDAASRAMSRLAPVPGAESHRLAELLHRLVVASAAAPEPPGTRNLSLSRRLDPDEKANVIVRLDQSFSDLNAFRDDSHLAAWQPCGLNAIAWEALTFAWRGEAHTPDELFAKLPNRGHSRDDYAQALADLAARGLAKADSGTYALTRKGQALRQKAEEQTDQYFYAPWKVLSEGEVDELSSLLEQLRGGLASPVKTTRT